MCNNNIHCNKNFHCNKMCNGNFDVNIKMVVNDIRSVYNDINKIVLEIFHATS